MQIECIDYYEKEDEGCCLICLDAEEGCWCCPKQNKESLQILYQDYPNHWKKLKQYEKDSPHGFKPNIKLRDLEKQFKNSKPINNHLINQTTLTSRKEVSANSSHS